MFSPAIKRRSVALAALPWLFSLACASETATPTNEPALIPDATTPATSDSPTLATGNQVGDLAPDFTLTEVSTGQPVQLADLTERGRPVALYFFTTW